MAFGDKERKEENPLGGEINKMIRIAVRMQYIAECGVRGN
jgi:hypothetical protein